MPQSNHWTHFQASQIFAGPVRVDLSKIPFPEEFRAEMQPAVDGALKAMQELEAGAIANPDEGRQVGHYWLRNAALAPKAELREVIEAAIAQVKAFAARVHEGKLTSEAAESICQVVVVGIGGSALGPQLASSALAALPRAVRAYFVDNTDPLGVEDLVAALPEALDRTLTIVISKSGGTQETRNGMLEMRARYEAAGLSFAKHAVAVTGTGSPLEALAKNEGWLEVFPMWDWVGGRTSELSAVGLLPAALEGIDIDAMLAGARDMDELTRNQEGSQNPAVGLALAWHFETGGKGQKDMVILPYKDRLSLTSRYLQQLVMESLGKELDVDGNVVEQGIAVYGNKGSTDQHAYVQQLRDGVNNFFAVFIEVLRDGVDSPLHVEPNITSGDYLSGFLLGTRNALGEKDRHSITLTIEEVTPYHFGALVALFERAVGLYATMVNINAYHQPGVEAGKRAAQAVLQLQTQVVAALTAEAQSVEAIAEKADPQAPVEWVYKILEHLNANPGRGVQREGGPAPATARYKQA